MNSKGKARVRASAFGRRGDLRPAHDGPSSVNEHQQRPIRGAHCTADRDALLSLSEPAAGPGLVIA